MSLPFSTPAERKIIYEEVRNSGNFHSGVCVALQSLAGLEIGQDKEFLFPEFLEQKKNRTWASGGFWHPDTEEGDELRKRDLTAAIALCDEAISSPQSTI